MRIATHVRTDVQSAPADRSISFQMEQCEVAEWLASLASLRGRRGTLDELENRLEDALRLAVWGRNDVILDLSTDELAQAIEELAEGLATLSAGDLSPLGGLLQKLSSR